MKIEHVLFPSVFFKITDPFDGRLFLMCSDDLFFGTNKNRILKNGSCEQTLRLEIANLLRTMQLNLKTILRHIIKLSRMM